MTPEESALARLVAILDDLAIPYMVAGSLASSHHGRPRTTNDIDVVVDPSPHTLELLVGRLAAAGFYVDADVAREALRRRRQFNAIDTSTGAKLDLIVRKDRAFSVGELARRRRVPLGELAVALASPEDTIVSKLEWAARAAGSEKQLEDVRGVVEVLGSELDLAYVERWAAELGVLELWRRVRQA